jgi:outer membrane protein
MRISLATALCWLLAASAMAQTKIGVVNLQRVFDGYWKTKQADVNLKERSTEYKKQYDDILASYGKSNEEYKKLQEAMNDQALAAEERDKRKKTTEAKLKEIQEIEVQIQQFKRTADENLTTQRDRMREAVIKDIQEVVNRQAKTAGYSLVFDVKADSRNLTPVILYNNGENEMSAGILKELNAAAPPQYLKMLEESASTNAPAVTTETAPEKKTKK